MKDLRPSPIAGTWYPGDPEQLRESIDHLLADANPTLPEGEVIGVIVPHAGHRYSGHIAAHAFRCFEGQTPDVIAIVSPLHSPFLGDLCTTDHEAYLTPLGPIPVDHDLLSHLETIWEGRIRLNRIRNDPEHSLEIELPFLQRVLAHPFRLLPIMIARQTQAVAELLGHALANALQGISSLLVASSDLSHFYPASLASRFDRAVLDRVEAFDPEGVMAIEEEGAGFACGRGAIASILWAARDLGADQARVVAYGHSGDVTGDNHSVVGYGAAVIYRSLAS
jgi:AmmeMemoRadiSam system protein B